MTARFAMAREGWLTLIPARWLDSSQAKAQAAAAARPGPRPKRSAMPSTGRK